MSTEELEDSVKGKLKFSALRSFLSGIIESSKVIFLFIEFKLNICFNVLIRLINLFSEN